MTGRVTRKITTFVLIAALLPAPGLAWPVPVSRGLGADATTRATALVFAQALNSVHQSVASLARPQIYLVFNVDLAVQTAGNPMLITGVSGAWFDEFLKELLNQPATTAATAATSAPADSILDQMEADDAHVRSMAPAKSLANMPDSLPVEANPNDSVPVERSMSVALEDALQAAGIDNPGGIGGTTYKRGTGTVTYEGRTADGDIVVTGRLVDGRMVLTKEFKPLTGGGDVGEAVRIRGTGPAQATSQSGGTQTAVNEQTPNVQTPNVQTATTNAAPGARVVPAEAVRQWGQDLYAEYEKQGQLVAGSRDAQGRLLDVNGQVIAPTTVAALKLVQNAVVTDLQAFTADLQARQDLTRAEKIALGQDLEVKAQELRAAAAEFDKAKAAFEPFLASEHLYNNSMARAAQLERGGDMKGAAEMRAQAEATPYARYVAARERYIALLNQTPLLGIKRDGKFLYEGFADPTQFPRLAAGVEASTATNQRYVDLLNGYFAAGIEQTKQQGTELGSYNTVEKLAQFASPAYANVHDRLTLMGGLIGSTVPADMMAELRAASNGALKSWTDVAWQRIIDRSLVVLQVGVMFLPGGPLLALALAGVQIARAGKDTADAYVDAQNALDRAAVAGYERVVQTSDNLDAAAKNLVLTTAFSAFDVYGATQYARLVRLAQAEAAVKAAQQGVPTSPAVAAPGATPSVAGSTTTSTRAATTASGPQGQPRPNDGWDPSIKVPGTEDDAVALFKREMDSQARVDAAQEVQTEVKLATDAGVDGQVIKDITKNFDANGSALGNRVIADELMKARLVAQGYDINMPRDEFLRLQAMSVRTGANGSGLTPDDIAWLNAHAHPGYFEKLPQRGFVTGFAQNPFLGGGSGMPTEGFFGALDAESAMRLQAAWKGQGGQFSAAAGDADAVGTQIFRPGAAAAADNTGTVTFPPGSQPGIAGVADTTPTGRLDSNKTTLDPNGTTLDPNKTTIDLNKTVITDPNKTSLIPPPNPTSRVDPNRTVTMDPNKTALVDNADTTPTVRLDPNKTTLDPNKTTIDPNKTVITDPNKTSLIPPPNPAPRLDPNKTVTMAPNQAALTDPNATARMTSELMQSLPKAQQSGMSPQQMASSARGAMSKLGVGPQQLVNALRQRLTPRPVSMSDLGNTTATTAPGLNVSLEALGVSSGDAFKLTAVNQGPTPLQLRGEGIVVEPVPGAPVKQPSSVTSAAAPRQSSSAAGVSPVVTQTVEAFCLERVRPVATPGTQYRVAPPAVQTQHRGLVDVLHAAQRISSVGGLRPDSEIKSYFNFVRQWSIWTRQENFDEKRFTEEFVNQTKKNVESQGVKWTDPMQATVRKAAPGRWRDIGAILDEANKPKIQAAAGAPSPSRLSNAKAVKSAAVPAILAVVVRRRHRLGDWS